ncbi:hypothetical protein CR513_08013, partial [Mucuna pruriens]
GFVNKFVEEFGLVSLTSTLLHNIQGYGWYKDTNFFHLLVEEIIITLDDILSPIFGWLHIYYRQEFHVRAHMHGECMSLVALVFLYDQLNIVNLHHTI